jgi:hypothetical protein
VNFVAFRTVERQWSVSPFSAEYIGLPLYMGLSDNTIGASRNPLCGSHTIRETPIDVLG